MKAIVKEIKGTYWICCANCWHKLAKAIVPDDGALSMDFTMEFKCTSCRAINVFDNDCEMQYYEEQVANNQI